MHTSMDRHLASRIFRLLMNVGLCRRFNAGGRSQKMFDQYFLAQHVYGLVFRNAVIHDSYHCKKYANSKPFPTQRIIMDHVGSVKSELNETKNIRACPKVCRPPDHQDWTFC